MSVLSEYVTFFELDAPDGHVERRVPSRDLPTGFYFCNPTAEQADQHFVVGPFESLAEAADYGDQTDWYPGEYIIGVRHRDADAGDDEPMSTRGRG